jgi:hypothetical protein
MNPRLESLGYVYERRPVRLRFGGGALSVAVGAAEATAEELRGVGLGALHY